MRADVYERLNQAISHDVAAATATVLTGGEAGNSMVLVQPGEIVGSLGSPTLDDAARSELERLIEDGGAQTVEIEGRRIFFEAHLPPPHLVVIGAVHIAIPLVSIARIMGYKTTVIDARGVFATDEHFPHTDDLIEEWPDDGLRQLNLHPGVAAVILAHDEKFEDPALEVLLRSEVGYIGAVGSRNTSAQRLERLRGYGFTDEQLARIHGPVGLDLGGRSPQEIALSIMAEIIAVRNGKDPREAMTPAKAT